MENYYYGKRYIEYVCIMVRNVLFSSICSATLVRGGPLIESIQHWLHRFCKSSVTSVQSCLPITVRSLLANHGLGVTPHTPHTI